MILQCQNLTKFFKNFQALKDVSFSVKQGECFGLLGPNGAGKSTLISLIYGAAARSSGKMTVFDMDPMTHSRQIKKRLGVVTQKNFLDLNMSVRENMLMYGSFVGLSPQEQVQQVDQLLDFMNLSHKSNEKIQAISGGMQRRLAFVRALLGTTDLLILDEPTTGLDPAVRHLLWEKVNQLKANGVTILLTTHYMDEAEKLCDRLVILNEGSVEAISSPKELIKQYSPGFVATFSKTEATNSKLFDKIENQPHLFISEESTGLNVRGPSIESLITFSKDLNIDPHIMRPSNLEDVFLLLTGKELSKNA
jgi:lipooligosaccharide transport system ATP-binding protein